MKTDASGKVPRQLCEQRAGGAGGSWSPEGTIVFSTPAGPLFQVPADGGAAKQVTTLDSSRQEIEHGFPSFLPDGRHFLYLARSEKPEKTAVFVASLDGGRPQLLLPGQSFAIYVSPGYLLFSRGTSLVAQAFDPKALAFVGGTLAIAEQVGLLSRSASGLSAPIASASQNGVLCYLRDPSASTQLAWCDRAGRTLGTIGELADYTNPALSRDERRLAVGRRDPQTGSRDIWIADVTRGTSSR